MNKYHLFVINNEAYKIYKNHTDYLYKILLTLFHMKIEDFDYGIKLYNDICSPVSVKLLTNYFVSRFNTKKYNNYLYIDNTKDLIRISPSNILLITPNRNSILFKIFNIYNKKILVIDFNNNKYFWLNDIINNI